MRIVFFGSGDFGLPTLKKLLESRHDVVAVVTQPDKKKGRGWNVQPALYRAFMEQSAPGVEVLQPERLSDAALLADLKAFDADLFVVIDYGRFLPGEVLSIPKKYCINLHPSLLPRYRGAAPVNRLLMNGEELTGNTVIKINERMDAGDIIMREETPVLKGEDAELLAARLSVMGAALVLKALDIIEKGEERPAPQDEGAATCAPKLTRQDGEIDWKKNGQEILRKIKGAKPWPGAYTYLDGKVLKVHKAKPAEHIFTDAAPGTVVDANYFVVRCGEGFLEMSEVQLEGKRPMSAGEFLRGHEVREGILLG